jgi:hypothetical protein
LQQLDPERFSVPVEAVVKVEAQPPKHRLPNQQNRLPKRQIVPI